MRPVMRTFKDARDVTAYIEHCSNTHISLDFGELWVQISCVLEEAEAQGLIVEADVVLVITRMRGPVALDGTLFESLRGDVAREILSRVDGCTPGFTAIDVSIVRGMVPHLAALVVKAGILEVASMLAVSDGGQAMIRARVSPVAAEAAWQKRKSRHARSGDVWAYVDRQRGLINCARKEIRWARSQQVAASVAADASQSKALSRGKSRFDA